MKIAVLAPIAWRTPPRKYGPWELVASNIAEELVKRGFDVTFLQPVIPSPEENCRIPVPEGMRKIKIDDRK